MSFSPRIIYSFAAASILLLASCSEDPAPEGLAEVKIPLYLTIPKGEPTQRAIGDPGTFEVFKKPDHLFLFVLNPDGTTHYQPLGAATPGTMVDPIALNPNNWKEEGELYRYDYDPTTPNVVDPYLVVLPGGFQSHHVYVAASTDAFALTLGEGTTLDERIRNATFDLNTTAVPDPQRLEVSELQHLYSSPATLHAPHIVSPAGRKFYNTKDVRNVAGIFDGKDYQYYGNVFDADTRVPYLDITLFHVAAKVDLLWNVAPADRAAVRLIEMKIEGMRLTRGKIFQPMHNMLTDATADHSGTHSLTLQAGDQWNGRHYFYALPYSQATDNRAFPLRLTYSYLNQGGATQQKPAKALDIPFYVGTPTLSHDKQGIFVPWVRYNVTIKN